MIGSVNYDDSNHDDIHGALIRNVDTVTGAENICSEVLGFGGYDIYNGMMTIGNHNDLYHDIYDDSNNEICDDLNQDCMIIILGIISYGIISQVLSWQDYR